ncbi:MAG: flagellar biosynthetic protein FliO [Spirochaetes bacterium]|nr:flagellar biosynthetic protein FliO [Spirochaetota bacterium]
MPLNNRRIIFAFCLAAALAFAFAFASAPAFAQDFSEPAPEPVLAPAPAAPALEIDPILAAEQAIILDAAPSVAMPAAPATTGVILRMVLTLVLVALAVYGIVFFMKRAGRRTEASDPFLKILASANLGANRHAHVVSVGSKAWLLGASEGGVSLIGEIDDKDVLDAMFREDARKSSQTAQTRLPDFKAALSRFGAQAGAAPSAENIRKYSERLKGM